MLFYNTYIPGKTLSLDFICFEHTLLSIVELLYVTFWLRHCFKVFKIRALAVAITQLNPEEGTKSYQPISLVGVPYTRGACLTPTKPLLLALCFLKTSTEWFCANNIKG